MHGQTSPVRAATRLCAVSAGSADPAGSRGRVAGARAPATSRDSRTNRKSTHGTRDQPRVEEDGGRPRAGRVTQHAADRRREHGTGLADEVVHAERRAVMGGVGDVGDHRLSDRLHRVEEGARAEQQGGHQPDRRRAAGDDEPERDGQQALQRGEGHDQGLAPDPAAHGHIGEPAADREADDARARVEGGDERRAPERRMCRIGHDRDRPEREEPQVPQHGDEGEVDEHQVARAQHRADLAALAREDAEGQRYGQPHLEDGDPDVRQPGGVADEVDGHDGGQADRRVGAEMQRRARVGLRGLLAAEVHRDPGADQQRRATGDEERHPPGLAGPEDLAAQLDHVRREDRRQRDAEGQSGDDDAHAEAALLDRRLLGDQAAVVGVEGALAQAGEHADGDEEDQTRDDAAQQGRDAGPHEADRDQGPVAVAVAEVAAGPLGEHVAGEEQAADEPAERVGLRRVGEEGDVVADHPRHHRPGEGAVGGADRPTQQQPEPERAVWRPRSTQGMRPPADVLSLHRSRLPSDYSGFGCPVAP